MVGLQGDGPDDLEVHGVTDHLKLAFEKLQDILGAKGADYQVDADPWSNFRRTGEQFGLTPYEAAEFNVVQKLERLHALRENGRAPVNEAVEDTYLDLAAYGILTFAAYLACRDQLSNANSSNTVRSEPGNTNTLSKTRGYPPEILDNESLCREARTHKGHPLLCILEFGHDQIECEGYPPGNDPRRFAWKANGNPYRIYPCADRHDHHSVQLRCTIRKGHDGTIHEGLTAKGERVTWPIQPGPETGA